MIFIRFKTLVLGFFLFLGFIFSLAVVLGLALPSGKAAPNPPMGIGGSGPLPPSVREPPPAREAVPSDLIPPSDPEPFPGPERAAEPAKPSAPSVYTIRRGDTLWSIARGFQITASALASHNGLSNPDAIKPGQRLEIPSGGGEVSHVVRNGETLWEIALRYGLEIDAVVNLNQLEDPGHLAVGQRLRLPVAKSAEPDPAGAAERLAAQGVSGFRWPLLGTVTSVFGPRGGRMHNGLDIAGNMGDPIKASKDGTVSVSGWVGGYGNTVILRHDDGSASLYAHASALLVKRGQTVRAGQTIARVGSTGNSTGPHLHFEVIEGTRPIDPSLLLPPR